MENEKRELLKKGQIITLSNEKDGGSFRDYLIENVVGEGGSSVCYDAKCLSTGKIGKLKEFYPPSPEGSSINYYWLKRLESGQLVPRSGSFNIFSKWCKEHKETYDQLNAIIASDPEYRILKNYIQDSDILYGTLKDDADHYNGLPPFAKDDKSVYTATLYIWSSGMAGRPVSEYTAEIREDPKDDPDTRISDIMNIMIAVTDGIRALHNAGIIHLDIKPSNFLLPYNSGKGINTANITMFDINTFYNIRSDIPKIAGTVGYCAHEVLKGNADHRSDIYSIGAMLFSALVIVPSIKDGLYNDSYYGKLDQLVRHSKLIDSGRAGSDFKFMSRLSNILKKCLAYDPEHRFQSCSELLDALRSAEALLKQYTIDERFLGRNRKYAVVSSYSKGITEPTIVMQKLLHEHTLFEALPENSRDINVLVVSENTYGQKFIDVCLEAGQIKDHRLTITSMSYDPKEDMESYVQFRPSMGRFVSINGALDPEDTQIYADLDFVGFPMKNGNKRRFTEAGRMSDTKELNSELAADIIGSAFENKKPYTYIFIALGSDKLNKAAAALFESEMKKYDKKSQCPICYVTSEKGHCIRKNSRIYPVDINEEITPESISPELERMAFNTHITWKKTLDLDYEGELKKFRGDKYNYSSSMAFVLSIKYKLYSLGIVIASDMTSSSLPNGAVAAKDLMEAAKLFREHIDMDDDYAMLAALEHRRWVINLAAYGWKGPVDRRGRMQLCQYVQNSLANVKVKDDSNYIHHCLMTSTEKMPLRTKEYTENGHKKWDDPDLLPELDDLDTVSVELHRLFKSYADAFRNTGTQSREDIEQINRIISGCDEHVIRAFSRYRLCLKNILNGVMSYSAQYDSFEEEFINSLEYAPKYVKEQVAERIRLIKKAYFPVIEANMYRDYKDYDTVLIKAVPFILTHTFRRTAAMAFDDGRHDRSGEQYIFADIASSVLLCPEKISYYYVCDELSDEQRLADKLHGVLGFFSSREASCRISFTIIFPEGTPPERAESFACAIKSVQRRYLDKSAKVVFEGSCEIRADKGVSLPEFAAGFVKKNAPDIFDASPRIFADEGSETEFLKHLENNGIPYFELDNKKLIFTSACGCGYLRYTENSCKMQINDILSLLDAEDISLDYPEFADDLEVLSKVFSETDDKVKNELCSDLKKYEDNRPPLASFDLDADDDNVVIIGYVLPEFVYGTTENIIETLKEYGVIDHSSEITGYTSENCRVKIVCAGIYKNAFDRMFSAPHELLRFYRPKTERCDMEVKIVSSPMKVDGISLTPPEYELLGRLEEAGIISKLRYPDSPEGTASFEYISQRIKKILTSPEGTVSIRMYYQLLKTGEFDDAAWNCIFRPKGSTQRYKYDVVTTNGFNTLVFRCRSEAYPKEAMIFAEKNGFVIREI